MESNKVALAYNFTYPSYYTFMHDVLGTFYKTWTELNSRDKSPIGWITLCRQYANVETTDVIYVILLAICWTILRISCTAFVFQPIVNRANLPKLETIKAPESAWKVIFYSFTWSYSIYLLFFTKNNFFFDAPSTFYGWDLHGVVPKEIYIAYLIQLSFYVHSVYATLYIDMWRKDSVVMLAHHVVTMLLIAFSYVFRYTNVGILVLFLHDITDIILEATKLAVYFKTKGGRWHTVCDALSTVGFLMFGTAWFMFRLYWYPLKAMYAAGYVSKKVTGDLLFYHFFNGLLWILLGMNIYWFMFIVIMAYKVVTGQANEVEDTREFDTKMEQKKMN
uniref:Ceramide synthase 1 n=1 Tax=Phallusia mammillata TaxID=59560 RepID=A0A6F9D8H9_9ASCI|nr:ceramide synthase 1 [Phallusia mammillata]